MISDKDFLDVMADLGTRKQFPNLPEGAGFYERKIPEWKNEPLYKTARSTLAKLLEESGLKETARGLSKVSQKAVRGLSSPAAKKVLKMIITRKP
jgi:hypothetical protein